MKKIETASGVVVLGALALGSGYAMADIEPGSQEIQAYAGQLFGDKLTDTEISGRTPELDDDVNYGVRYTYNFTKDFGFELSLSQAATSVTQLAGGDVDLDLALLDVDAVWHLNFVPNGRIVPYLVAGLGYADATLDNPIQGTVNGQPVRIDEDSGITANAGIGAKFFVTDTVMARLDVRYRYVDGLVDTFDDSLNTVETTLGVAWKF